MNEIIDVTPIAQSLKWWCFDQNNSGGSFTVDENVCETVFIQARNVEEALDKAHEILDESGMSWCECCGERWSFWKDEDDGKAQPEIYGTVLWEQKKSYFREEARLHFWDGRVEKYVYGMPRIE